MSSNNLKEPLKCPKCGEILSKNDDKHKRGRIQNGNPVGNGGKLGLNIVNLYYNKKYSEHPFYIKCDILSKNEKNGIEAHHLITSSSLSQDKTYQNLALYLGYNINHSKNGVLLPNSMTVACHFGVPLHRSRHNVTFIKKQKSRTDIDTFEGMISGIKIWEHGFSQLVDEEIVFPSYDVPEELTTLNYENHVNNLVSNVCKGYILEEKFCKLPIDKIEELAKNFINDLDDLSQSIFRELYSFDWTLTSDGFDYRPGDIGCCKLVHIPDKRKLFKKLDNKLADMNTRQLMSTLYSDRNRYNKLKEKLEKKCNSGSRQHENLITNNNHNYFLERKNLKPFEFE